MDNIYWYCEYIKVFIGYAILFYIWPNIVFHRYLSKKGLTFRFVFCSAVQVVLINGVISGLGLLHILNRWIVRGLFYGLLIISAGMPLIEQTGKNVRTGSTPAKNLLLRGYGWKTFWIDIWKKPVQKCKTIWREYKSRRLEYLILTVILIFGMVYFSYSALRDHSYGCYDQYTHTRWIFALREGNIFSEGIYPEAMHCFIYSINALFGIKVYSCMQFLAGIYSLTFLASAYCLMKELFMNRYTPLFVLTLFLTFEGGMAGEARSAMLLSMTRMTWTLPEEFGWYLVFLCPLFLIRFFRKKETCRETEHWFQDENLCLLMIGVGASFAIHFYVTMLAFFICLTAVAVFFRKLLSGKKLLFLIQSVWYGMLAGSLPMMIAYITGGKIEGSIWWGIQTFRGEGGAAAELLSENKVSVFTGNLITGIYKKGYAAIFGQNGAWMLAVVYLLIFVGLCIYYLFLHHGKNQESRHILFLKMLQGYLFLVLASVMSVFLYAAPFMRMPEFISVDRFFGIIKIFVYAVIWIPFDFLFFLVCSSKREKIMGALVPLICVMTYCFSYFADFHEYLFWTLKRYNMAVSVTAEITEKFRKESYAVISMGDELCQVEEQERYVQLLDFLQNIEEQEKYILPSEYIFIYIEKAPLRQGQTRYFTGPSWLGKKSSEYTGEQWQSWYPEYPDTNPKISQELSEWPIYNYPELKKNYFGTYFNLDMRTILCSKVYYWYQKLAETYPMDTNVYYEDEYLVCYMIHQNPSFPLNLALRKGE